MSTTVKYIGKFLLQGSGYCGFYDLGNGKGCISYCLWGSREKEDQEHSIDDILQLTSNYDKQGLLLHSY